MARTAAKKKATPLVISDDESDDTSDNNETYLFFVLKVLPNSLPTDAARRKILEKQPEDESRIQLKILDRIDELNLKLKGKSSDSLFKEPSLKVLYNNLTQLQVSQHFAGTSWKTIGFACCIPMTGETQIFSACVYHTRSCPLFFKWSLLEMADKNVHPDLKLNPVLDLENIENPVANPRFQIKAKPTFKRGLRW